jgi:hypothetical protein
LNPRTSTKSENSNLFLPFAVQSSSL